MILKSVAPTTKIQKKKRICFRLIAFNCGAVTQQIGSKIKFNLDVIPIIPSFKLIDQIILKLIQQNNTIILIAILFYFNRIILFFRSQDNRIIKTKYAVERDRSALLKTSPMSEHKNPRCISSISLALIFWSIKNII